MRKLLFIALSYTEVHLKPLSDIKIFTESKWFFKTGEEELKTISSTKIYTI